jgi:phosphoenolpyruvate carboxylase
MGAVYLARLYGVEKKLDISPLFETPQALESGGRFIERLLREPEYRDYVSERGRISIQLGFSDSGRFMGQCAAGLATERLQVLFARALAGAKMTHLEALVFNTHGESMGRGAHPNNFTARMNHLSTPWVRSRFAKEGIALAEECSFQGGEGYLHFQTAEMAQTTLALVWNAIVDQDRADSSDEFYSDINYSWDFYRGLKTWQEGLFQRDDYRQILSSFAQRFLYKTGSRQAKRAKAGGFDLSALRAIPHNAILQQIAAPVNVSGGFGAAAGREMDRLVEHIKKSARMRDLTALAEHARGLTDLSVLRAYAALYAPSYWSLLATSSGDERKAEIYESVQSSLGQGDTSIAFHRLTDFLATDIRRFDAILSSGNAAAGAVSKNRLKVLHAIRQALMARAITLVAGAPAFSRRHDVAHRDLVNMALEWRLADAAEMLREIFPAKANDNAAFSGLAEHVEDHSFEGGAYPEIHRTIIEPIEEIAEISHVISKGIAHHYGAFG